VRGKNHLSFFAFVSFFKKKKTTKPTKPQNSSLIFARTYPSQGQDESLSHHHNKPPRVCLLYQCTSHQECFPLFPVCIYSCGCLQGRKTTTKLSETVVKIFISHSPAELFVLLFSKAALKSRVLRYERNRSCLLPCLFPRDSCFSA